MPDQLLLVLAAMISSGVPQVVRVGVDQVPPGSKCVQSAVLSSFVGQPASAALGAQLMAASGAPKLRWVAATAGSVPRRDSKLLVVRLDAQNRVLSANCAGAGD
jgi:hypothetical protein